MKYYKLTTKGGLSARLFTDKRWGLKKAIIIIIGAILLFQSLSAQERDPVNAAIILKMGAGARAEALSEAFTAYYDDATVAYWNPAAMVFLDRICVSSMLSFLVADFRYNFFNAVFPTDYGTFGAALQNLSSGSIEGRTGETDDFFSFEYNDLAIMVNYGYEIVKGFAAGANLKIINTGTIGEGANGISLDISTFIKPTDFLSIGVVMRDFFGFVWWTTGTREKIQNSMTIGAMLNLFDKTLRVSFDAENIESEGVTGKTGLEYEFFKILFLRGGVSYRFLKYDFNYTLGGGVKYDFGGITVQFDYAYFTYVFSGPQVAVDTNHKMSLALYFETGGK